MILNVITIYVESADAVSFQERRKLFPESRGFKIVRTDGSVAGRHDFLEKKRLAQKSTDLKSCQAREKRVEHPLRHICCLPNRCVPTFFPVPTSVPDFTYTPILRSNISNQTTKKILLCFRRNGRQNTWHYSQLSIIRTPVTRKNLVSRKRDGTSARRPFHR